ncbi:hypothetical protein AUR66_16635 [Haloferax profundi]|uniref:Uncharacterized protein n=1 Tax=Haloferax profundi TaxID=1544718 RepID=A0A0W1SE08_9EURY|nr:hypothetical protein AUR66_16635 [Haloferax profundi]
MSFWPTGGGYLVFCVKREYHPGFESYYVVDRKLVGVAEVEDRQSVRDVLRIYDYNPDIIKDLPVYEVE